ncbi:MAG: hypothetical protein D6690_00495 [Nitrospirae bacterium]|nr:MAG: hypothetical protein D6690_00495 [Nitrospirota bacterium]
MNKRQTYVLSLFIGGALLALPALAQAGGTIKGKVTFSGKVPPPKEFAFKKFPNPDFCKQNPNKSPDGEIRLLKEVELGPGNGLKNAIVAVRDITDKKWMSQFQKGKKPAQKVIAKLCEFLPYTGVAVSKGYFYVENQDADPNDPKSKEGVLHNPHAFDVLGARSATEFNIGLAKKGDSLLKKVKLKMSRKGGVMRLQCDQHEFMQGWYLPVTNPYFVKVNDDGSFELKDVPAGKHKILAWHPVAGKLEKTVDVKDGATVEVNFEIK